MRGLPVVTIAYPDGKIVRGYASKITTKPDPTMRVGGFGPFSHAVPIGDGSIELEMIGLVPIESTPSPMAPEPASNHEEAPMWGAYA